MPKSPEEGPVPENQEKESSSYNIDLPEEQALKLYKELLYTLASGQSVDEMSENDRVYMLGEAELFEILHEALSNRGEITEARLKDAPGSRVSTNTLGWRLERVKEKIEQLRAHDK